MLLARRKFQAVRFFLSSYKILNLLQLQEDKTWEEFGNLGSNSISTLGIASRKIGHENGLVIEVESERLSPS